MSDLVKKDLQSSEVKAVEKIGKKESIVLVPNPIDTICINFYPTSKLYGMDKEENPIVIDTKTANKKIEVLYKVDLDQKDHLNLLRLYN